MNASLTPVNDLAKLCAHSAEVPEWEELVRRCSPLATVVARRISRLWVSDPSPAFIDDIVQEVFLKLCEHDRRILRSFEPRGEDSFFGLLRLVTASVTNDYYRRQYSTKRGGKVITMPLLDGDSAQASATAVQPSGMQHSALLEQLDRKLLSAPKIIGTRDRALFWLYYRQGFTAEEISRLPAAGLTPKGVESALRRVTVWLRQQIDGTGVPSPPGPN
jgi:RNA polymerase sigma-70 factor (ECF subfamily)